jgi:hypothetical protein
MNTYYQGNQPGCLDIVIITDIKDSKTTDIANKDGGYYVETMSRRQGSEEASNK